MLGLAPVSAGPICDAPPRLVAASGSFGIALSATGAINGIASIAGNADLAMAVAGDLRGIASISGAFGIALDFAGDLEGTGHLSGVAPIALVFGGSIEGLAAIAGRFEIVLDAHGRIRDLVPRSIAMRLHVEPLVAMKTAAAPIIAFLVHAKPLISILTRVEVPVDVGDTAKITTEIRINGALIDPEALELVVRPPTEDRYVLTYPSTITRTALGRYEARVPCTETGKWRYQWVASGADAGAETGSFTVDNPPL